MSDLRDSVAQSFGKKLAAARAKADVTQEELSDLSAIHRTEIAQLESGLRSPRLDTVVKIAGALDIEPCELMVDVRWVPPSTKPGGVRRV